jgi:DNA-binding beta-propeller fold protein YncE
MFTRSKLSPVVLLDKKSVTISAYAIALTLALATGATLAGDAAAVPASGMAESSQALQQFSRVELPKYTGDFDRFGYDVKSNRLFVAGEYTATVEVFDLTTGAHQKSLTGFGKPQGFIVVTDQNRLIVADSREGAKVFDATTYELLDTISLRPGTNTMGYDSATGRLFVQTGGAKGGMKESFFTSIDLKTRKQLGELTFKTDLLKAVAIEKNGPYLYTSVTGKDHIAVIDKKSFKIVRTFPITAAAQPSPLALDEANNRLFVITRAPYKLIVLNTQTGVTVASFTAPERTNDVQYDEANHRIYAAGDGYVAVVEQNSPDRYTEIAKVPTAHGAKTAMLVPELNRYYVAVAPGPGNFGGALLGFKVAPVSGVAAR